MSAEYNRVGLIGRFKPLHLGHEQFIRAVAARSEYVTIGIGSANRFDAYNPMTIHEVHTMLERAFDDISRKLSVCYINDTHGLPATTDGKRWEEGAHEQFGTLDAIVTGNPWVRDLLKGQYKVLTPDVFVPLHEQVVASGTEVRDRIIAGEKWEDLVSPAVAQYLVQAGIDERIRAFGKPGEATRPAAYLGAEIGVVAR